MIDENKIVVEVAYALPQQQSIISLEVTPQTTAMQAIIASGITTKFPEIDLTQSKMGIFGKQIKPETILRAHDRVEIYRPLIADPKLVRKQRAAHATKKKNSS